MRFPAEGAEAPSPRRPPVGDLIFDSQYSIMCQLYSGCFRTADGLRGTVCSRRREGSRDAVRRFGGGGSPGAARRRAKGQKGADMKLVHLSDLHLGKRVNEFSMLEDQKDILNKIIAVIKEEQPDAVLIAGDVYDKSVPSAEAVELFDEFLVQLT